MINRMYEDFQLYFPVVASKSEDYYENGHSELIVKMKDGSYLSYDYIDKTIRNLPIDKYNMTEDECKREFRFRLYKIMCMKGVNQKELSELVGVSEVTISKYLNGHSLPSFYIVDKIAKALDCSLDELRYF